MLYAAPFHFSFLMDHYPLPPPLHPRLWTLFRQDKISPTKFCIKFSWLTVTSSFFSYSIHVCIVQYVLLQVYFVQEEILHHDQIYHNLLCLTMTNLKLKFVKNNSSFTHQEEIAPWLDLGICFIHFAHFPTIAVSQFSPTKALLWTLRWRSYQLRWDMWRVH
jgi:hypothetical protein